MLRLVTKLLGYIWYTLEQGSGSENEEKLSWEKFWGIEWIGFGDC